MWPRRKVVPEQPAWKAPPRPAWRALIDALDAVADEPHELRPRADLAVTWAMLAGLPPVQTVLNDRMPGFSPRPDAAGVLQDCRIAQRAIDALTELIDATPEHHRALRADGVDIADLIALRGVLHHGLWRVDRSAPDLERAADAVADEELSDASRAGVLRHRAAMMRADFAMRPGHDEELMARVREAAQNIGAGIVRIVSFTPTPWIVHAGRPADVPVQAEFEDQLHQAAELGFTPLGWLEDPSFPEKFGHRALCVPFARPVDGAALWVGGTPTSTSHAIEARMSDGRILGVNGTRGRVHFTSGPWIDHLAVDPIPLADLLAIHEARVRCDLALRPGVQVLPVQGLQDWIALEDHGRRLRLDYRLREGLTELEVRGIGFPDADLAMPIVQGAARDALEEARRAHTAAEAAGTEAAAAIMPPPHASAA